MDNPSPPAKDNKGFFDIVPAGKKPADSSSRPLLVTNQPQQKDPMVATPPVPTPQAPEPAAESLPSAETTPPAAGPEPEPKAKKNETPEPAEPQINVVVSRHKMAGRTLHNVIEILLILIVLAVIA